MRKKDIDTFIEEMEAIGDEWTPEQVEDVAIRWRNSNR